jgi:microcin C transport system ATP-binding protein
MTSLNPLHTVEKQIGEVHLHRQGSDAEARARTLELLRLVGLRRAGARLDAYPARALRRPAPARDDRDGAGQRAGPADRRRADHRARRDDPGADPGAAAASCSAKLGMALLLITHDLGVVRKMADRVCVMRGGRDRRAGPGGAGLRGARSTPTRDTCWSRRAEGAARAGRRRRAHRARGPRRARVVPDPPRRAAPHRRAREGGGRRRLARGARRRDGGRGRRERQRQDHAGAGPAAPRAQPGLDPLPRPRAPGTAGRGARPLRREMQIVFQDPFASLSPRLPVAQIVGEGSRSTASATRRSASGASSRCSRRSASTPRAATATRTSSPAASASASRSPARWC